MGILALIPFSCAKTKTKTKMKTNALVCSGDNALTNEPVLQCLVVLRPGLLVIGFIQNERKLLSSGSFSFPSWHLNSL